jgi:cytochrome P450
MSVLERDFFTDPEIIQDPLPYYRALHERGPVVREPHKGVFMLSRTDEILEVYTDHERFSAIVGPLGPMIDLPQPAAGERWADVIESRRHEIPLGDQLMSLDPPRHTRHRALAGKLLTPNRLKQNEEFIWARGDHRVRE